MASRDSKWLAAWKGASLYDKFERAVALGLGAAASLVILFALGRLAVQIGSTILDVDDILNYDTFRSIFGMFLVVLIALEFNRTILQMAYGRRGTHQIRAVVIIGVLALVRKLLIVDIEKTPVLTIFGIAALIVALGAVYWLTSRADGRGNRDAGP